MIVNGYGRGRNPAWNFTETLRPGIRKRTHTREMVRDGKGEVATETIPEKLDALMISTEHFSGLISDTEKLPKISTILPFSVISSKNRVNPFWATRTRRPEASSVEEVAESLEKQRTNEPATIKYISEQINYDGQAEDLQEPELSSSTEEIRELESIIRQALSDQTGLVNNQLLTAVAEPFSPDFVIKSKDRVNPFLIKDLPGQKKILSKKQDEVIEEKTRSSVTQKLKEFSTKEHCISELTSCAKDNPLVPDSVIKSTNRVNPFWAMHPPEAEASVPEETGVTEEEMHSVAMVQWLLRDARYKEEEENEKYDAVAGSSLSTLRVVDENDKPEMPYSDSNGNGRSNDQAFTLEELQELVLLGDESNPSDDDLMQTPDSPNGSRSAEIQDDAEHISAHSNGSVVASMEVDPHPALAAAKPPATPPPPIEDWEPIRVPNSRAYQGNQPRSRASRNQHHASQNSPPVPASLPVVSLRSYDTSCYFCERFGFVDNCAELHWDSYERSPSKKYVSYSIRKAEMITTNSHNGCNPRTTYDREHSCNYSESLPYDNPFFWYETPMCQKTKKALMEKRQILLSQGKDDSNIPEEIKARPRMWKYWYGRYDLFKRFDEGIKLDLESWYSVTLEDIAVEIAGNCNIGGTIVDAFCGCGGNAIQFALTGMKVVAIDIDPVKIEYAKHNARIYGVFDKIRFMVTDFMAIADVIRADAVFLSPPWGGPEYINCKIFSLNMIPLNGYAVYKAAQLVSPNICYYLPRHVDLIGLQKLAGPGNLVEIHENFHNHKRKSITAYYGKFVKNFTPKNGGIYKGL